MFKKAAKGIKQTGTEIIMHIPHSKFRETILIGFFLIIHPYRMFKKMKMTLETLNKIKKEDISRFYSAKNALFNYSLRAESIENCKIYMETYSQKNVIPVQKKIDSNTFDKIPIFISAVKNDLRRVKMQVQHHKNIGIENFVYIDNMSNDGTFEWLIEQGIDVYRVDDDFSATAKNAWFRQITDIYGYNRWYLIMDSDELFVYPGMEDNSIENLIRFADREKLNSFQSFMIDMYPKDDVNSSEYNNLEQYNIKDKSCYFDTDTYFIENGYKGTRILGGPRYRIFSDENKSFTPLLTKNALIYLREEDFFSVHYSIPYCRNFNHHLISGLLHYKFLPGDNVKYADIAKRGNYAGGSAEYKQYVKKFKNNKQLSFYYEGSQKLNHSLDLMKIKIFDERYANKLLKYFDTVTESEN